MAEPTTPLTPNKRPWALTFFGLLAAGGLIAMPYLAGPPNGEKVPDIVRFIGHFHPVLLHMPIGIFGLILLQELAAIFFRKKGSPREMSIFPIFIGAASAIVAVIAGFLLYQGGGYEGNELAERHLWIGLAFAVAAVITLIVKAWAISRAGNFAFYRLLLFTSVGLMSFASHDGGSITHGSDYLTKYAPDPILKVLGMPVKAKSSTTGGGEAGAAAVSDPVVYADIIAPIFEQRCNQCHKAEKSKGKLRMDTFEMLVKGGKEGPAIEAGNVEKSNILVRMALPKDEDEHMPADGKPEPEAHEVVLIKWWISTGADPKKTLSAMGELPAPVKEALAKLPANHSSAPKEAAAAKKAAGPNDDLKTKVADIAKEYPGTITFESQESGQVVFNALSLRGSFDDAGFAKVSPVLPQLVEVDLSSTKITDATVLKLAASPNLRLIRLSMTGVTDASLDTLVKLKKLESINLYGTKVTDAGVMKLAELPGLKRLYLWQTAVTPAGITSLKEKMPSCEIITGI